MVRKARLLSRALNPRHRTRWLRLTVDCMSVTGEGQFTRGQEIGVDDRSVVFV